MDRRTALERLDAARPGSDDLARPEFDGVEAWLERDPATAAEWASRRAWDERLGEAFADVPVPHGLKARLLAAVETAADDVPPVRATLAASESKPSESRSGRRVSRRAWLAGIAGSAAGVAAAVYLARPAGPTVTVAQARDAAADVIARPAETPAFDASFEPRLPLAWSSRLRLSERAFGVLPTASGRHRGAAFGFAAGGRRPVRGVLVVLPADEVVSPPAARSPHAPEYAGPVDGSTAIAWTADGFVYVCCLEGNVGDLLRRLEGVTV